jgi:hypothetical protein
MNIIYFSIYNIQTRGLSPPIPPPLYLCFKLEVTIPSEVLPCMDTVRRFFLPQIKKTNPNEFI